MIQPVSTTAALTFEAGENYIEARDVHSLGIHMGEPLRMLQRRDGRTVERIFLAGDVVVIPAGLENYCVHDAPASGLYVDLPPALLEQTASQLDVYPDEVALQTNFGASDPQLKQIVSALHRENSASDLGSQLFLEALMQQLLIYLLRHYTSQAINLEGADQPQHNARRQVQSALDLIHSQYHSELSLDQLAAASHLSRFHFSRVFKTATGLTPHQYLIRQRLEQAQQLLKGAQSIAEIAVAVGVRDQSHLTRLMKRHLGITPHQFRQEHRR